MPMADGPGIKFKNAASSGLHLGHSFSSRFLVHSTGIKDCLKKVFLVLVWCCAL